MHKIFTLMTFGLLSTLAVTPRLEAASIQLPGNFLTHYQFNLSNEPNAIDGIVKFEADSIGGLRGSWPDFLQGGPGTQEINQVFPSNFPLTSGLLLGMVYDGHPEIQLNGVGSGTPHLAIMMSNEAAAIVNQQPFETVFSGYTESDVINALEVVGQIGSAIVGDDVFNADYDFLAGFATSLTNVTDGVNSADGWFNIPSSQSLDAGQFSVVTFSDGELVGTGSVTQTNAVPEPSSFALLGLGGLGLAIRAIRRRRQSASI